MSKGASRAPQEIKMLFAVLPETFCQGLFHQIHKKLTKNKAGNPPWTPGFGYMAYLWAVHICRTSFFSIRLILSLMVSVLVVLKCTRTFVGCLSNLPYQRRGVLLRLNGRCAGCTFNVHLHSSFLWVTRSPLPPFSLLPHFPPGSSSRQREWAHSVPVCGRKCGHGQGLAGS